MCFLADNFYANRSRDFPMLIYGGKIDDIFSHSLNMKRFLESLSERELSCYKYLSRSSTDANIDEGCWSIQ